MNFRSFSHKLRMAAASEHVYARQNGGVHSSVKMAYICQKTFYYIEAISSALYINGCVWIKTVKPNGMRWKEQQKKVILAFVRRKDLYISVLCSYKNVWRALLAQTTGPFKQASCFQLQPIRCLQEARNQDMGKYPFSSSPFFHSEPPQHQQCISPEMQHLPTCYFPPFSRKVNFCD